MELRNASQSVQVRVHIQIHNERHRSVRFTTQVLEKDRMRFENSWLGYADVVDYMLKSEVLLCSFRASLANYIHT